MARIKARPALLANKLDSIVASLPLLLLVVCCCCPRAAHFFVIEDDPPTSIVANKNDESGSWTKWTSVTYYSISQCRRNFYRLHFHCADQQQWNRSCAGAKLLVCYPSQLDPKALPDFGTIHRYGDGHFEDPPRENELLTRADTATRIRIDKNSEIAKQCSILKKEWANEKEAHNQQRKDEQDRQKVQIWHGFMVTREADHFVVQLPFSESQIIVLPKSEHFFLRFGSAKDPMMSFIDYFNGATGKMEIFIGDSEKYYEIYLDKMTEGMPMDAAKHLWLLGLDILPFIFHRPIHFYTKGWPSSDFEQKKSFCQKEDNGLLKNVIVPSRGVIEATLYSPESGDPNLKSRLPTADINTEELKGETIELDGKRRTAEMDQYLADADFYVHGRVSEKAEKFSILLNQGIEKPNEQLGERLLEISVKFEADGKQECNIKFFPAEAKSADCKSDGSNGFNRGKLFWLWVKIKEGKLLISLNCLEQTFTWKQPRFSPHNYISFDGDIEIELHEEDTWHKKLLNQKHKFADSNVDGKPTLSVYGLQRLDDGLKDKTIILLNRDLTSKSDEKSKLVITLISSDKGKPTVILQMNVDQCPPEAVKRAGCQCWHFKSINFESDAAYSCSGKFNLILIYHANVKAFGVYLDGTALPTQAPPRSEGATAPNYVQMSGDFGLPDASCLTLGDRCLPVLKSQSVFNHKLDQKMDYTEIIIIYALIPDFAKTQGEDTGHFTIKLNCPECYKKETNPQNQFSLLLKVDLVKKCMAASSYSPSNDKQKLLKDVPCIWNNAERFPISFGELFWVKIAVEKSSKKFQIFVDGSTKPYLELEAAVSDQDFSMAVKDIQVIDKTGLHLLNRLSTLAHRQMIRNLLLADGKTENLKPLAENTTIEISVHFLKNAKFVELFLIRTPLSEIKSMKWLGQGSQTKFKGTVFMHIKSFVDWERKSKFCVLDRERFSREEGCLEIIDDNFLPGKTYTLKLKLLKESILLQMNSFRQILMPIRMTEHGNGKNPLMSTHIVINGDIALLADAKVIVPVA